ncbi:hypothetical protein HK102_009592, partial [Quaeritorhiza haematococci]
DGELRPGGPRPGLPRGGLLLDGRLAPPGSALHGSGSRERPRRGDRVRHLGM